MINGNEMKAFYRIFIPRKKDDSEHSVGAQEVNETRLNDNFRTVLDEFRKLWDYIKNGFKTKTLEVEGNATIGGDANIAGNANINGEASVDGNVAADLVIARAIDVAEYAQVGTDIIFGGTINSIGIEQVNILANSSKTFALANSTANLFILSGSTDNLRTMIIVYTTAAGVTSYTMDPAASSITVTTGTNSITIASAGYVRVVHFTF